MFYTAQICFPEHAPTPFRKQRVACGGRVDDIDLRRSDKIAVEPRPRAAVGDDHMRHLFAQNVRRLRELTGRLRDKTDKRFALLGIRLYDVGMRLDALHERGAAGIKNNRKAERLEVCDGTGVEILRDGRRQRARENRDGGRRKGRKRQKRIKGRHGGESWERRAVQLHGAARPNDHLVSPRCSWNARESVLDGVLRKLLHERPVVVLAEKSAAGDFRAPDRQPSRDVDGLAADVLLLDDVLEDFTLALRRMRQLHRRVDCRAHA